MKRLAVCFCLCLTFGGVWAQSFSVRDSLQILKIAANEPPCALLTLMNDADSELFIRLSSVAFGQFFVGPQSEFEVVDEKLKNDLQVLLESKDALPSVADAARINETLLSNDCLSSKFDSKELALLRSLQVEQLIDLRSKINSRLLTYGQIFERHAKASGTFANGIQQLGGNFFESFMRPDVDAATSVEVERLISKSEKNDSVIAAFMEKIPSRYGLREKKSSK